MAFQHLPSLQEFIIQAKKSVSYAGNLCLSSLPSIFFFFFQIIFLSVMKHSFTVHSGSCWSFGLLPIVSVFNWLENSLLVCWRRFVLIQCVLLIFIADFFTPLSRLIQAVFRIWVSTNLSVLLIVVCFWNFVLLNLSCSFGLHISPPRDGPMSLS